MTTIASYPFIVVPETATLSEARETLDQLADAIKRRTEESLGQAYILVRTAGGQVKGVLSPTALENHAAELPVGDHPYLNPDVGSLEQGAPDGEKQAITGKFGLAVVLARGRPVELLGPELYGGEVPHAVGGGLSVPAEKQWTCSSCGNTFRYPLAVFSGGRVLFQCPDCGHEIQRP